VAVVKIKLRWWRPAEGSPDHEIILLALSAALFAWLMRAVLDIYFYSDSAASTTMILDIPAREIYSRAAIATCFVLTGGIISRAVHRLRRAHARERRLDQCVRSVRAINQLITRVDNRATLCKRVCDELVTGLGYNRVEARLEGVMHGSSELPGCPEEKTRRSETIPICCNDEVLGELIVTLHQDQSWDDEERALLEEVAEDIAFSILSMRTSERLAQQREEVQTILDSVSAYITYKDRSGRYIQVNRALADVAGIPQDAWVGKKLGELVPGAEEFGNYSDEEVMSTGSVKHTALEALDLPKGTRWVQSDRVAYRDDTGATVGVISLSVDVTDRMEAERALSCKEEQLRQSQKMEAIGQLAGGVAHDFNNLLTAISGYTELACGHLDPDAPAADMLSSVLKASDRAAALTKQLLAFSRKQPLRLAERNINEVVTGMTDMLKRLIGEDIELITDLSDDIGRVDADVSQMEQVLMNLSVNARDAMPDGGRLTIRTARGTMPRSLGDTSPESDATECVCLSVIDTGIGMDEETRSQIFEPFFTTKKPGVGTGLGLSVVDGIVKQHGGVVRLETGPGRGTAFHISLPVIVHEPAEDEPSEACREAVPEVPSSGGERVLLVEDEDGVRAFASRALSEWGYDIVGAPSAEEALVVLETDKEGFDLVFSDIVLPGKSGTQLAEEICSRNPDARILLTSGYLFPERPGASQSTCEIGFPLLKKPYSTTALRLAIHEALE
jgi:PAS domain S-box-containing protein